MKSTDLNPQLTANALNENMYKQFNVKINFDKYTREQLENARNILRTKTGSLESTANFNDLLTNETYQKDKYMLGVLNTKIKEMLGESIALAERKLSTAEKKKKEEIVKAIKRDNPEKRTGKGKSSAYAIATAQAKKTNEAAKPDANKNGIPDYAEDGKGPNDLKKTTGKKGMSAKQEKFFGKKKKAEEGIEETTMKKTMEAKSKKPEWLEKAEVKAEVKAGNKVSTKEKKKVKVKESELKHRAYQQFIAEGIATYIAEDEEGKAKSITAAADMVNDFTSWMQRVGNYQTKSMIELADNIRANFGMQEAEQFKQSVAGALEGALSALTQAREEINNAVAVLAGEAPAEEQMGMDDSMDTGMEEPGMDDMNPPSDEFSVAADSAAGAPNAVGRMKRESIDRGNRLMRILGS